ncbi:MAG: sialate O-acetylesterase [Planctomycetota bacterium]
MRRLLTASFAVMLLCAVVSAQRGPLKVYILAGQSNMQGHAKVETFDHIGDDPATKPLLRMMRTKDGKPRVCEDVWISYLTADGDGNGEGFGKLTAGYGARRRAAEDGGKIGPEFTFGLCLAEASKEPILIIKCAWGGKSLHTDFRSPSAGPYEFTKPQLERLTAQGKDIEAAKAEKAKATGHYYRLMVDHVKHVLGDIKRVYPKYQKSRGFELAGFVWFQGFNDLVDRDTYPDRERPGGYDEYSRCLTAMIEDLRKDLEAPELPVVIGVIGVEGPLEGMGRYRSVHENFRAAMAAPAARKEFKGRVVAVETSPFWDVELAAIQAKLDQVRDLENRLRRKDKNSANADGEMSPAEQKARVEKFRAELITPAEDALWARGASNAGYHYLGSAKTMAQIGQAFAKAFLAMK